jgi:C-terminal processing protease CtpA/Prc
LKLTRLNSSLLPAIFLAVSTAIADSPPEGRILPDTAVQAASELAELLRDNYLFPEIGLRYSEALEARIEEGLYSTDFDLVDFAGDLETVVNDVHPDAHLRVSVSGIRRDGQRRMRRTPGGGGAIGTTAWIDDDIAYLELLALPGDEASQEAMANFLDQYRGARALILDARLCPGGTLPVIDVLSSRLFDQPTHLVTMDMRVGASDELQQQFDELPSLRRVDSEATLARYEHWTTPSANPADRSWADVPVYLLTNMTASACEHLALALKVTDRATLIGKTTRGAGHFGGLRPFAGGSLNVFLPVGRTYDPTTGKDWESVGVEPDIDVPADQALQVALTDLGVDPSLAANISSQRERSPATAVRKLNPGDRGYGLGIMPPRSGDTFIEVMMVQADGVAAAAGVQRGDRIAAMNGTGVADMDQATVIKALQSPQLALEILRSGEKFQFQLAFE